MGGGGKGGRSSSAGDNTIRYAPYLEEAHREALKDLKELVEAALGQSPYDTFVELPYKDALLHPDYELTDYPALWDMFGKFVAGLDVHKLWHQTYQDVTYSGEIQAAVSAQAQVIQDEIDVSVMPKFLAGMRDINAVNASSFVVGKAIIQDSAVKAVNTFAANIRIEALKLSASIWSRHLDWSQAVVASYSEMMKLYFMTHMDMEELRLKFAAKHEMWDLNLMEHVRAMLGALGGGTPITDQNQPSQTQKSLAGALSGAAAGASIAGPWGAGIGGAVGLAASFL